jgi:hypothetical protein
MKKAKFTKSELLEFKLINSLIACSVLGKYSESSAAELQRECIKEYLKELKRN